MHRETIRGGGGPVKYHLGVNQLRLQELCLAGRVRSNALLLLDYLHGWIVQPKAERMEIDGLLAVWIDSGNTIRENPQLFKAERHERTNENRLCRYLGELAGCGLIRVHQRRNRRFVAFTELGASLFDSPRTPSRPFSTDKGSQRALEGLGQRGGPPPSPRQGLPRTPRRDELNTGMCDEKRVSHIDETRTKETPPTPASGGGIVESLIEEIAGFFGQTSATLRPRDRNHLVAEIERLEVSDADLGSMQKFIDADEDRYSGEQQQRLRGRKRKLSTFVADFGHQLTLARKFAPLPPRPKPEPIGWEVALREMFSDPRIPSSFWELPSDVQCQVQKHIAEHPPTGWREAALSLYGPPVIEDFFRYARDIQAEIRRELTERAGPFYGDAPPT